MIGLDNLILNFRMADQPDRISTPHAAHFSLLSAVTRLETRKWRSRRNNRTRLRRSGALPSKLRRASSRNVRIGFVPMRSANRTSALVVSYEEPSLFFLPLDKGFRLAFL